MHTARYAITALILLLLPQQVFAYQINTTEKGKRIRWSDDALALRLDPRFRSMLAEGEAPQALEIALDAWRGLPGVPDFMVKDDQPVEPGHAADHPTNAVYLLADWPYEADKLAITVVTYELDSGRLLDADVLVNPDATFELLEEGETLDAHSYDLAAVLTHEAGHILGLGESGEDPEATMWPYARMGETHQRTLSHDDEEGVIEAYRGPAPLPVMGCGPSTVARGAGSHVPAWLVLMMGLLGVAALRLARERMPRRPAGAAFGLGLLLIGGGVGTGAGTGDALAEHAGRGVELIDATHHHTTLVSDLSDAERLERLLGEHGEARVGRVERVGARQAGGMLLTDYRLSDERGEHVFQLPGGELDGIGQRVGHGELPTNGTELLVVEDATGVGHARWAFHDGGRAWGGWLGDGPAIQLAHR